jgi:predicted Zn-dependent protease
MKTQEKIVGEVTSIHDEGTIVQMFIKPKSKKHRTIVINFDHRAFRNMWDQEAGVIEGRKVRVVGPQFAQTVEFLD